MKFIPRETYFISEPRNLMLKKSLHFLERKLITNQFNIFRFHLFNNNLKLNVN